jgi:hypothetical protein
VTVVPSVSQTETYHVGHVSQAVFPPDEFVRETLIDVKGAHKVLLSKTGPYLESGTLVWAGLSALTLTGTVNAMTIIKANRTKCTFFMTNNF